MARWQGLRGVEPENCEQIAAVLEKQGDLDSALTWAEKGIALKSIGDPRFRYSSGNNLPQLHRRLLKGLGRKQEAFQGAWSEFEQHPSIYTYREVAEFVDPGDSRPWYEKARDLILNQEPSHLSCSFDFLTAHSEHDLLRNLIERTSDEVLENLNFTTLKQTAKAIERRAPLAAAKLYKAEALEILTRAKAKAYHYALENLAKVKALYETNGRLQAWTMLAAKLKVEHKRKSSFIGEFNMVVTGVERPKEPTFMERVSKHLDD